VPSDRRTEGEIRGEIAAEREQLVAALSDLRDGVKAKRRTAGAVGGLAVTALAAAVAARIVRRIRAT
jgi:hypothetical protein